MATLYEIDEEILNCVDQETGEIIGPEKLAQLQMDFDKKVEGIALWIKNLLSDAEAIKAEKNKLADRQRSCENKARNLKEYLSGYLCGEKFKTPRVSISKLDEEYLKFVDPEVDKTKVKKALKDGIELSGVVLVQNNNIQIR